MHALDELLLRRAPQAKESDRLGRARVPCPLPPAWTDTHEKFDAWVLTDLEVWARKQRVLRGIGAAAGGGVAPPGGAGGGGAGGGGRVKGASSRRIKKRPVERAMAVPAQEAKKRRT